MTRAALGWATLAALGAATGCAGAAPGRGAAPILERTPGPKQLQPRQIIVALAAEDGGASSTIKQALASDHGLVETGSFLLGSVGLECVVFQLSPGRSIPEALQRLSEDPRVVLAQENQAFQGLAPERGGSASPLAYAAALLQADAAQRTRSGKGVRVAVIDTGVAWHHPALRGSITATQNFVEGGEPAFERDRHGTAVAGVIGARGDGARVRGIAPAADILAVKACWYTSESGEARALCSSWTLAKALDFAISSAAHVMNLSLGGPPDRLLARLVARACERGIITIAAAQEGDLPGFPAALPGVIAVLASDDRGRVRLRARPSSALALAAPGVDILATAPEDGWDFYSGSSLAAAHVTGVVALLREQLPSLDADGALDVLRSTATALPGGEGEPAREVGLVNACAALARLMGLATCP